MLASSTYFANQIADCGKILNGIVLENCISIEGAISFAFSNEQLSYQEFFLSLKTFFQDWVWDSEHRISWVIADFVWRIN